MRSRQQRSSLDACSLLSDYGVDTRYPGDLPELSSDDATNAASLAEKVRTLITSALITKPEETP